MKYLLIALALIMAGCASKPTVHPIPEATVIQLSNAWVISETCFNAGHYTSEDHALNMQAVTYSYSTWDTSKANIQGIETTIRTEMTAYIKANTADTLKTSCTQAEPSLIIVRNSAVSHYNTVQRQLQQQHEIQRAKASSPKKASSSKYVQCTKIGGIGLSQEVKTFKSYCPLGWW